MIKLFSYIVFQVLQEVVEDGLRVFPNTYFNFSGLVKTFGEEQKDAIRKTPLNRILFKTVSPYLPLLKEVVRNSPICLGEIIQFISDIRGSSLTTLSKGW